MTVEMKPLTELKNRGVADIFIACVDGLKGFPEAIETVFPKTVVQLCLVHMVRHPRWPLKVLHLWPVKLLHPDHCKLMR